MSMSVGILGRKPLFVIWQRWTLLMLFKKIIELLPKRSFIVRCLPEFTIVKLEIITEVASILIKHPFRLGLTALIVMIQAVVAAVEAGTEICPTKRTGIFPSYDLGYVDFLLTLIAYSHIVIRLRLELSGPGAVPEPMLLILEYVSWGFNTFLDQIPVRNSVGQCRGKIC